MMTELASAEAGAEEGKAFAPLGWPGVLLYASGSLGTGVFSTVPTVLLLFFSTETLHISAWWASVAVFLPKAWSIFWDPFVGAWSDRARARFMAAGGAGVALAFAALFSPPSMGPLATALWVATTYFAMATLYSLFAVPYVALPAELGGDAAGRARLVTWRIALSMVGLLMGAGLAPLLVQAFGGGRDGFSQMALVVAAACGAAMAAPVVLLRGRDAEARGPRAGFGARRALSALQRPGFRPMLVSYLLQLTGAGAISSAAPYLVTRVFGRSEGDTGVALLGMLTLTTLSIPAWSAVGRRLGDVQTLTLAAAAYAAAAVGLGSAALLKADWPVAFCAVAALGIPFGGLQVIPFTLLAHLVARQASGPAGTQDDGLLTGLWTAGEKLGLALGPASTGVALSLFGGASGPGLPWFVLIVPALLVLTSIPILRPLAHEPWSPTSPAC